MTRTLLLLSLAFLPGCLTGARRDFARGAAVYAEQILPAYKDYLEKDKTLEADSKRIRAQTADEFQRYIDEGMK